MKNVADSSFQSLPIVDNEQAALSLARYLAVLDVAVRVAGVALPTSGAVELLFFGTGCVLPVATTLLLWGLLRGPLLASFSALAVMVTYAVTLGPVVGLLAGLIFWASYLVALNSD